MIKIPFSNKPLVISCDFYSGTGYATFTREYLKILYKNNIDFRILPEPELFQRCTMINEDVFFENFIIKPYERNYILENNDYNYFRLYPPRDNPKRKFNIGYTMVEGYSVNPHHTKMIDNSFDLILVPSYFVKDVLSQTIDHSKIRVVPLGVDLEIFNSKIILNSKIENLLGDNKISFRKVDTSVNQIINTSEKPTKTFNFGSNAKFCHRKGVDLVIKSFIKSFTKKDDVSLVLFYQPENPFEPKRMDDRILEILSEYDLSNSAPIYIYDQSWKTAKATLPYEWIDCYVFPSRGEGFGLTPMEAGACRIPLICSNNSALGEFINNSNAFVIDVDKIDNIGQVEKQYDASTYSGNYPEWTKDMFHHQTKNCYFPIMNSNEVLSQIMEYMIFIYNNQRSFSVLEKTENLFNLIENNYTWDKIEPKLINVFSDID